jgi:hypothetical protein
MTLKDIEQHIPILRNIKDYTAELHGTNYIAEWVVYFSLFYLITIK